MTLPESSDPAVQALVDRAAIRDVIMRYALAVDGRDFDALRDCFTPDAHAKYSDWFDDSGVDKIIPFVSGVAHFEVTQHFFGQSLIEVRGDEADARTYSNNHHFYTGDDGRRYARVQGNLYTERFVRRDSEWRIADLTLTMLWERDEPAPRSRPLA